MGWTGAQYSLWRAALAIAVVGALWTPMPAGNFVLLALALPLAIGWYDRVAACALAGAVLAIEFLACEAPFLPAVGDVVTGWVAMVCAGILIAHACVPRAPFGSFRRARQESIRCGGWRRPLGQISIFWGLLAVVAIERF